jgi:Fur family ferric uptake transcriptional regulator
MVLEAVTRLGHATPEQVAAEVRDRVSSVNISTVYRTLELLETLGLVTHAHLGHGAPTYHRADEADHVHLVCRVCDRVTEMAPDAVQSTVDGVAAANGFRVDVRHLTLFGVCRDCAAAGADGQPSA